MNVLYFHQHFSTPEGSTGIRSYEMAKRLIKHGHDVTIVCGSYSGGKTGLSQSFISGKREGMVDGINIIEFDLAYSNSDGLIRRSYLFFKFALKSIWLALTKKYDVVFATTTPLTAGIPGIFARWFRRKSFVFEVRDLWPELPKEMGIITNPIVLSLMSLLEWLSYHSAHRCIALSPGIKKGIEKRGINSKNIELVPNGCDFDIFSNVTNGWRPQGVNDSDLMAIFTGTHGVANGLDALLDTAIELKKRGREDIKMVLVGQGKLKAELQLRAEEAILDNVIFLKPVNKSKLAELMKGADIGLQLLANIPAFYYGTSPNKFFDYISAGLPVLNNYPGWLATLITENECGYAIKADDAVEFANKLEHSADNKELLRTMGNKSEILAKKSFDRHYLADKWVHWVLGDKS